MRQTKGEGKKLEKILKRNNQIRGVKTNLGTINCEYIVLCAGMWSRQIGEEIGVSVPLYPNEHFYIITEPIKDLPKDLPVLRDYNDCLYLKEDVGKMLVGIFEPGEKMHLKIGKIIQLPKNNLKLLTSILILYIENMSNR